MSTPTPDDPQRPPPPPPLALDYAPKPSNVNAGWKVGLRFLAGAALAFGSIAGGAGLAYATGLNMFLFGIPAVVFAVLVWVQKNLQRKGYVAGFVAPYIISLVALLFLFMTCIGLVRK